MNENTACCICMEKCTYFQDINDYGFGEVKYIDMLSVCVPKQQWETVFKICSYCVDKLDNAYHFIQLCLKSEEFRNDQLTRIKESCASKDVKCDAPVDDFTCYQCNKSFRLKRILSLHITRIHVRPKKNLKRIVNEDESSNIKGELKTETEERKEIDLNVKAETENENNIEISRNGIKDDLIDHDIDDVFSEYPSDEDYEEEMIFKKKELKKKIRLKRGPKPKGPRKCPYCELEFTRHDKYMVHVRTKHTFEKPFKCSLCDSKYVSQANLTIHMRKHLNERPFVCSSCGKSFTSSNDLWQHNKIHDEVRQYHCDECTKSFKTHSNLRTHKHQVHQDPEQWKYICTVCGKKFPLNNNLIKHMKRHEGKKDFLCHLCDKKFVEKVDLQNHMISHSNERNFKCTECTKEYKKRETLRRHMKVEHNMGNFVIKKIEKTLMCPLCPKLFAFNNKLQRHIATHTGAKNFKCDFCDKRFRDSYDRNTHVRQVHNKEPKDLVQL